MLKHEWERHLRYLAAIWDWQLFTTFNNSRKDFMEYVTKKAEQAVEEGFPEIGQKLKEVISKEPCD